MTTLAGSVSIEMGSLDGNVSEKEDGVVLTTSARILNDLLEETLNAHQRRKRMWNIFFLVSCCIAVFLDPLFCYSMVIYKDTDEYIMDYDWNLMGVYSSLRPIVDAIYMMDLIIFLPAMIRNNIAKTFGVGWCSRTRSGDQTTALLKENQSIKASLHKLLPLLPHILAALPIQEIIIISRLVYQDDDWNLGDTLSITIPMQCTLRMYDFYASLRRRLVMKTGIQRWLKHILDFLPFILASHLFGALWYHLAIQRQLDCWKLNCKAIKREQQLSATLVFEKYCPVREENFGIYLSAVQSNQKGSTPFVQRVSQSFWWALRNLSSFGLNLSTSSSTLEIYFSILISISGMTLFLVYLIARVQEAQEILKKLKEKQKKQLMIPDVD